MSGGYGKFFEIDADRESSHDRLPPLHRCEKVRVILFHHRFRQQSLEAAHKIVTIAISLKTNQVELEQGFQNALPPGQLFKNIGRRKWDVQEEPHPSTRSCLSQISRHDHEVIIVHPNEIFIRGSLEGGLGKFAI